MAIYFLGRSKRPYKKYYVRRLDDNKSIHFGNNRYEDYTQHKDDKRKLNYLIRHQKNEDWLNPNTAGFWAKHLLWNKKSIQSSIKDIENRFGIKVRRLKNN